MADRSGGDEREVEAVAVLRWNTLAGWYCESVPRDWPTVRTEVDRVRGVRDDNEGGRVEVGPGRRPFDPSNVAKQPARSPQGEYPRGTTSPCTPYPEAGKFGSPQGETEVEAGDRFEQVMPYGRDTVQVEGRIDAERVAVVRASGARQVFPVATLLNKRFWRRSPQNEDHEEGHCTCWGSADLCAFCSSQRRSPQGEDHEVGIPEAALDAAEAAVHGCRRYALGHPSRKAIYVEARDEAYDVLKAALPHLSRCPSPESPERDDHATLFLRASGWNDAADDLEAYLKGEMT